jgi:hypothetical protein
MLEGNASHLVVLDLHLNGLEQLARELKIPVFGSGAGNHLETDRWFMANLLEEHQLPVIEQYQIEGLQQLEEYLKHEKDKFIKVSVFRGDLETFHFVDWESAQPWFNRLQVRFGPIGHLVRFIVQDPIPSACELGIDTYFSNGWMEPAILGCEIKDAGYAGRLIQTTPKALRPIFKVIGDYFASTGYNCFFSNEMRITEDGTVFMTDATCRVPSPPGGVMSQACGNFSQVVLKGEPPNYGEAKYFCEIVLKSDVVADDFLRVDFPKKFFYAFHNYFVLDGKTWIIPHDSKYEEFGSALGWGAEPQQAAEMAEEAAEAVNADGLHFATDVLQKAREAMAKGESLLTADS